MNSTKNSRKRTKAACVVAAVFLVLPLVATSQVVYNEDFNLPDGTTNDTGATAWSTSYSGGGIFSTAGQVFFIYDLGSEGVWTSQSIDISAYGYAVMDIDGYIYFAGAGDYLRFYYSVDGGPQVLFGDFSDGLFTGAVGASSIVSGNSLVITVRAFNNGVFDSYSFDNVVVTGITTLYSRKSGNWNDAAAGTGTWSILSHAGAACGCTPNSLTRALIGTGHTVDMNADGTTGGIEINSGTLRYTAPSVDLNIVRDYYTQLSTGVVDRNGQADSRINFSGGAIANITMDGPLTIDDIDFQSASTLTLAGNGAVTVMDDMYFSAVANIVNNKSNTFTITDRIMFNAASSGATFTSNQSVTAGSLYFDADQVQIANNNILTLTSGIFSNDNADDDNVVTNAPGATLNLVTINPANADLDVLNSGTINQSGNFTNITSTDSNFDNFASGTWNWTLTPNTTFDTDMAAAMNMTAVGNTFNYSAAGAQRIIPTTYHHLTLSNSGAKDANNASFSVQGNWTVSGTASFTEGTGTVTLNGANAQSITNPSGETFNNLVINNSFATSPQITTNNNVTVNGILTMSDGNINLTGTTLAIAVLSHAGAAANGWTFGGTISRTIPTTAIAIGNVAGMFPIGNSTDFRPFFVGKNSIALSGGTISVSYTNSTAVTDVTPFADGASTVTRVHNASWNVVKSAALTTGTWSFQAGGTGFVGIGNIADLRLTLATSALLIGTSAANTGTPADFRVNRTGAPASSLNNNFHIATVDIANSPLPIVLRSFDAELVNDEVELRWVTDQEINNDFFTIQKSTDGINFNDIGTVDGAGNSREIRSYQFVDDSPYVGISYYRLKQTDFDEATDYSWIVAIDNRGGSEKIVVEAFPNPSLGRIITISYRGLPTNEVVRYSMIDPSGHLLFQSTARIDQSGKLTYVLDSTEHSKGVYVFTLLTTKGLKPIKIVIN